ncbi:hypothetical protein [Sporosarcina sp. UB5]|uniref:hypothetical protein n=1 Tax=Sporosarcina sp. UB5 TaxID=3047463 RepID=UPI003D7BE28C
MKTEISNEQLVEEELNRIISGYFENAISLPAEFAEYDRYERQWRTGLGRYFSGKDIEKVTGEYYLFIARRDLWRRRIMRELNSAVRSDTRRLLKHWNDPIILLAKVIGISEDTVTVEQILNKDTYILPSSPANALMEGDVVFGVALYDDRKPPTNVYMINGLYRVADSNGSVQRRIVELAESSGFTSSYDFYNVHMMDIYKIMLTRVHEPSSEESAAPDVEEMMTEPQREVLEIALDKLDEFQVEDSKKNLLKLVFAMFCLKEEPIIRKPEVLAASLFKAAHEIGVLGDTEFTQAGVAKMFGVSVSAMMRNVEALVSYAAEAIKSAVGEK